MLDPGTTPAHPERSGGGGVGTGEVDDEPWKADAESLEGGVVRRVKSGDGGTGVVVMDVVGDGGDWDLVRLIVGMNMGVLMKTRDGHGMTS